MVEWVSLGLSLVALGGVCWVLHGLWRAMEDIQAIMTVLSKASPALERRVIEAGTQVVSEEQWWDDEAFDSESVSDRS